MGETGLQARDRATLNAATRIRERFLAQNAFTDEALSAPQETAERIRSLFEAYDRELEEIDDDGDNGEGRERFGR